MNILSTIKKPIFTIAILITITSAGSSCRRSSNDGGDGGSENLTLAGGDSSNAVLSAQFHFPTDHRQSLTAPQSHPLAGASLTTEANAFAHDMTIVMKAAVPLVTSRTARDLSLAGAISGAGPSVLIEAKDEHLDASQPMEIVIPVKIPQGTPNQNLTVLYHVMQEGPGGRNVIGLMKLNQVERSETSIKFRSPYFGIFQAVYYNGDPSTVNEARTSDAFYGLEDQAAKAPEAFLLQTPSGQITSTYPLASWSPSNGAKYYEVVVAKNKDCSDVVVSYDSVAASSRTIEGLADGKYFLCVSSISEAGTRTDASNNGMEFLLSTSQLGLFQYEGTRAFATGNPPFRWTQAQGATSYHVAIASSSGCPQPLEEAVTDKLSWTPSVKRNDGTYYFCVTATDSFNHKQFISSDYGRPQGEGLAITIDTTKPGTFDIAGIGGPRNAVSWSQSSEAVWYNLIISTDESCSQAIRTYDRIAGSQTSVQISGLQDGSSYHICLSSLDNAGNVRTATNSGKKFLYDTLSPKVLSVTSSTKPGFYPVGTIINVVVNFSEPVTLSGSSSEVRLQLNTNAAATYVSGTGSSSWQFTYKVAGGENAALLDYSSAQALGLGNSKAQDQAGNPAILTLPAPGSADSLAARGKIAIDTAIPVLTSSTPADNEKDVALRPEITLVFNESLNESSTNNAVSIIKASDQSVVTGLFTSAYNAATNTLKLTPKNGSTLVAATIYKIQVRGVRDFAGNEISATTLQFSTK